MDVLINFGRHAGEIRDIEPAAALAMLADGRASRPCAEVPAAPLGEVASRNFALEEIAPPPAAHVGDAPARKRTQERRSRT